MSVFGDFMINDAVKSDSQIEQLNAENNRLVADLQRHKQALEKVRVALIPFQCETCNGTHKFKFECPSCLSGEGSCTCATQPEEPCPQCQSDNGLKEVYANLEGALRHIDEVLK